MAELDPKDEIAQILSEIEGLQQDIDAKAEQGRRPAPELRLVSSQPDVAPEAAPDTDLLDEFRQAAGAGGSDGGLEDTLGELPQEPLAEGGAFNEELSTEAHEESNESNESNVHPILSDRGDLAMSRDTGTPHAFSGHDADSDVPGELTMTISGSMRLNLCYAAGGQSVAISFDNGALCVALADGTEFRVPMNREGSADSKKAA